MASFRVCVRVCVLENSFVSVCCLRFYACFSRFCVWRSFVFFGCWSFAREREGRAAMDDVKGKAKDLIKKFRNPFVVTPKFKGQGHKLGSQSSTVSSSASSSNGTDTKSSPWRKPESEQRQQQQQGDWRKLQQEKWERERTGNLSSNGPHRRAVSEEMPPLSSSTDAQRPSQNFLIAKAASTPATAAAFDPFTSVIGSHKSSSLDLTQVSHYIIWLQ